MRKFFTFLSKTLAVIFAILFVIAAVLVILLFNVERKLFDADLYKGALAENQIYERLPGIASALLTTSLTYNPCAENPLLCEDIPDELRMCYIQKLGQDRYVTLASGKDKATDAEMEAIQPCLDQFGEETTPATGEQQNGENPLLTASPETQACVRQAIGDAAYEELYNSQRAPTEAEIQQITPCLSQAGTGDLGSLGGDSQGGMPPFMKNLNASDWEAIIRILLPPAELKALTENVLDQVFAYLEGKTDKASVSLVALRERLAGPAGEEAIRQLIAAQPPCTNEQLAQLAASAVSGMEGMISCAPPEEIIALILPQFQAQLLSLLGKMPDKVVILEPDSQSAPSGNSGPLGNDPVSVIRTVRLGLRLSPLLPLGLLMLVTLFGVRSLKGWMRWWGIPFFFAGLIALAPGIALLPLSSLAWNKFVLPRIPPIIPADIINIGRNVVTYIVHDLSEPIVLQAVILLVLGLAAWIGSFFVKAKPAEPAVATPPTAVDG